jgi:DNA modification methylase
MTVESSTRLPATARLLVGDARVRLAELADASVQACITSPPYYTQRDYDHANQIGLETSVRAYVAELVKVFREVRRVLADDGTLWLNLGDTYAGVSKGSMGGLDKSTLTGGVRRVTETPQMLGRARADTGRKNLLGVPWRVAFALQDDGWIVRQDIIWAKTNPMPESVTDRCTKSHEHVFLLSKSERYYCDMASIAEPAVTGWNGSEFDTGKTAGHQLGRAQRRHDAGQERTAWIAPGQTPQMARRASSAGLRNKRDVWTIATQGFNGAHFAVMPEALAEPCVLAGSRAGDAVLDPFTGTGTVGVVALRHDRHFVGVELNPEYAAIAADRVMNDAPLFNECLVDAKGEE